MPNWQINPLKNHKVGRKKYWSLCINMNKKILTLLDFFLKKTIILIENILLL